MPSSYSSNLLLELMADGENDGLWGDITNENLEILGRAISGVTTVSLSGTTHTLTLTQGALSEGHYSILILGGSPTGTNTITIDPNTVARTYFVQNDSGEDAVFTQGSGGNVTVANGSAAIIYCDGGGSSAAVSLVTNAFTDAEQSKLSGLDQGVATTDSPEFAGLTVDTDTLYVDSANNWVGIGTSSPDASLHVFSEYNYNGTNFVDSPHVIIDNGTVTNHTAVLVFNSSGTDAANKKSGITGGNYYSNNHGLAFFGDISGKDRSATPDAFIDSSGKVGIGTSSPSSALEIAHTGTYGLTISSTGNVAGMRIIGDSDNSGTGLQEWEINVDSGPLTFNDNTAGSERMRIDSSGNVGIGTTSPQEELHIFAGLPTIRLEDSAGGNADIIGTVGSLVLRSDSGNTKAGSVMRFEVDASEAMRIDSSGNLLVGKTTVGTATVGCEIRSDSARFTSDSAAVLYLNREGSDGTIVAIRNDNTGVGSIAVSGSSTSYNTSSDERLKENITDAQDASAVIDGIQVRQFDWKVDGEHQRYGMIAQELDAVAPEAVTKGQTEDDMWSVDYSKLVPMLVKAMQEQQSTIEALEARITALEA